MKRVCVGALVLLAFFAVMVLSACEKKVPAGAIAVVGDESVPQEKFDAIMDQAKSAYAAQKIDFPATDSAEYNAIKASIVEYLVNAELVAQGAADMDVKVETSELDERLKTIVTQVGGQEKFEQLLKQQGMTEEDLRTQLEVQMLEDEVRAKVAERIEISEADMKAYYDDPANASQFAGTVTARHVLVTSKAEAQKVHDLLEADSSDANWKKVAAKYSKDKGTKDDGGNLGTFTKDRMVEEFSDAVFSLKVGEISDPVKTEFGYHIIEVTDKSKAITFDEAKSGIEQQLKYQREADAWQEWLDKATADAEIVYAAGYDPEELTASPTPEASPTTSAAPASSSASPSGD